MTECSCLSQKIKFVVYEARPWKWWEKLLLCGDSFVKATIVTIYGDTIKEIDAKVKKFEKEYIKGLGKVTCSSYSI